MRKIDRMTITQIISETGLRLTEQALRDIWNLDVEPEPNIFNEDGVSAVKQLENDVLVKELISEDNTGQLARFLFAHEKEIDKVKLVLNILRVYKDALQKDELSLEKRHESRAGIEACNRLLKDVDETFVYYIRDIKTARIESISIVNTREEAGVKPRDRKLKNVERLQALESEEELSNIVGAMEPKNVQYVIPYSMQIGEELRFVIEFNTALDILGGDFQEFTRISRETGFDRFVSGIEPAQFTPEMTRIIRTYIEEIDIDKMLMCSAVKILKALENKEIEKDEIPRVHKILKVIQKHIKKNSSLEFYSSRHKRSMRFDTRDLDFEMKKFIVNGEEVDYYTSEKCQRLRIDILTGKISLNTISNNEFNALLFNKNEIDEVLMKFPNNYIFFFRENVILHSKEVVLRNIINSNQCSNELFRALCQNMDMTPEEICELFEAGIISVSDLQSVKEQVGEIISDKKLFQKYIEYRDSEDSEKEIKRIKLERYALAYKKTELNEKTDGELEERGELFVENVGEDINPTDLIHLYGLDILPLKVAVDWGGEQIIEKLLRAERLKPADARYLRDKGLLDENILERLFQNCINMSYAYQVSLVCTVFDGETQQEREIKQRLAQYYHLENGISKTNSTAKTGKRKKLEPELKEHQEKIKMRDPGAKYNLLSALDKGVKIEEGIIDGHIIFHYPNIEEGLVLIEKLHKIITNRDSGLIEIKADNECATYIISEEEFIQIKSKLIQEGKIDRTQLTQKWFRKPGYWVAHAGKDAWERGIKERFEINCDNPRYTSPEDLARMEELLLKSSRSKDLDDR